jgi:hypothetical protein
LQTNKRDFFKSIPAVDADGYIIENVILNWDDETGAVILKNCLQAMKTSSSNHAKQKINPRLLVIDTIMPETDEPFTGKFIDVLMHAVTRKGRIRTEEFRNLLGRSGIDIINVIRSPDPVHFVSIIEARLITATLHKTTIDQTFVIALRAQSLNQKMLESDVLSWI